MPVPLWRPFSIGAGRAPRFRIRFGLLAELADPFDAEVLPD